MKLLSVINTTFIGLAVLLAVNVQAHSPELHKKENAEKPNCEAMNNIDHSKMDMNDPVMQAMMKQCMGDDHGSGHLRDSHHGDDHNQEKPHDGGNHGKSGHHS